MEGRWAGSRVTNEIMPAFYSPSLGAGTPYQFAATEQKNNALLVGTSAGTYTSMPADLTAETSFSTTSYTISYSVIAQ